MWHDTLPDIHQVWPNPHIWLPLPPMLLTIFVHQLEMTFCCSSLWIIFLLAPHHSQTTILTIITYTFCFVLAFDPLNHFGWVIWLLASYVNSKGLLLAGDFFSRGSAKPDVVPGDYDAAEAAYYTAASSISNTATTSHHYQNRSSSVSATASVRYGH